MGTISRPGKTDGGTSVATGGKIYASDWNGDVDTIYNEFNGNIEDDNVKSSAGIDPSKIDDYSTNASEAVTIADPGTTDSPSAATDLTGELTRLRYNDLYAGLGVSAEYHDGTSNATVGPWDGVRVGHNLVQNGSLQLRTATSGSAPDGWTVSGSPASMALTATGKDLGDAKALRVITGGVGASGLTQAIDGLKANTLYIIGCRARAVANAGSFAITGGASSGAFQNTTKSIAVHASTYTTYSLAVKSDATPSDITISLTTGATSGDEIFVHDVFMYEISKDQKSVGSHMAWTLRRDTSASSTACSGTGSWVSGPAALDLDITPEKSNQRVIFTANLSVHAPIGSGLNDGFIRVTENGTAVAGPYYVNQASTSPANIGSQIGITYIKENPTPGTTLSYAIEVLDRTAYSSGTYVFSPVMFSDSVQTSSELSVRVEDVY